MKRKCKIISVFFLVVVFISIFSASFSATGNLGSLIDDILGSNSSATENTTVGPGEENSSAENVDTAQSMELLFLLTLLALLPSIILMMTSFTRIIIVLSFTRNGLGLQQTPPNQVLIGLALFLSLFIMSPVIKDINDNAYTPYSKGEITQKEAFDTAMGPVRTFMLKQTSPKEMNLFLSLSGQEIVEEYDDIPTETLIPAFVLSELKKAFIMGFMILIPFLIIDMVVASTLMSMGMIMLPPTTIALPFKVILFVVVDGWSLLVGTLVSSFS